MRAIQAVRHLAHIKASLCQQELQRLHKRQTCPCGPKLLQAEDQLEKVKATTQAGGQQKEKKKRGTVSIGRVKTYPQATHVVGQITPST